MVTVPVTHVEYTWNLVVPWHHSWTGLHDVIESLFVYDIIVWDKIIWHHREYFCTWRINLENIHSNDPYKTESVIRILCVMENTFSLHRGCSLHLRNKASVTFRKCSNLNSSPRQKVDDFLSWWIFGGRKMSWHRSRVPGTSRNRGKRNSRKNPKRILKNIPWWRCR